MHASQVIEQLQQGQNAKSHIKAAAAISEMVIALQTADDPLARQILCDILGELHAVEAVLPLIACLDDLSSRIRSAAADALAKIGDVTAGAALLDHYQQETDLPVKRMFAAALGAVHYQAAIPALIEALTDADASLRGTAAWSLGNLKALEAGTALRDALNQQTTPYAIECMQVALIELAT